jgi:phospholipase C
LESFLSRAIGAVQSNAALWRSTAIFVTFDEGGGYYDSGYVQPVSFFGDGPRVPMIVVSPTPGATWSTTPTTTTCRS